MKTLEERLEAKWAIQRTMNVGPFLTPEQIRENNAKQIEIDKIMNPYGEREFDERKFIEANQMTLSEYMQMVF